MKRALKAIITAQIISVLSWFLLSLIVAVGGVFLTGQIPVLGLGIFLGCLGAFTHTILIALNLEPEWWKIGGAFALLLSCLSIGLGMVSGDRYPLSFVVAIFSFYFVFGALIYAFIKNTIVEFVIDE